MAKRITEQELHQVFQECWKAGGKPEMIRVYNRTTWDQIRRQFDSPDYWPNLKTIREIERRIGAHYA